jgi:hypothetical protein
LFGLTSGHILLSGRGYTSNLSPLFVKIDGRTRLSETKSYFKTIVNFSSINSLSLFLNPDTYLGEKFIVFKNMFLKTMKEELNGFALLALPLTCSIELWLPHFPLQFFTIQGKH